MGLWMRKYKNLETENKKMKNDMKLIMESWRSSSALMEQPLNLQRPATHKAGRKLTSTATSTTDRKISDLIAAFETSAVEEMTKKHSIIGAILKKFTALVAALTEIGQSEDASIGKDSKDLADLVATVTSIVQKLNEFYEKTKGEFTSGMTGIQVARKLFAKGAEGILLEGPEIFSQLVELSNNPIIREVAVRAGIELIAVEVLDEFIPLLKKTVGIFKFTKSIFGLGEKSPAFRQALDAKDPNKAFEMIVTAAMQVDDSKSDLLGPLKALDVSDEFLAVFDKQVSAEFAKEFIEFLKKNSNKFMKQGMADDIFKNHVNNKAKGKFRIN